MMSPVPDLAAIRALADEWWAAFPDDTSVGINIRAFAYQLRELLDTIPAPTEPTGVTSVEPGCTCGGMAACQQCQDRDAATEPTGEREALVAAVLAEHGALGYDDCDGCECGSDVRTHEAHRAHVAAAVVAALSPTPHDGTEGGGE